MKAWDTNFLVRHLVEDDARQLAVVRRELQQAQSAGAAIWLSDVTLVETFWVLQQVYGLTIREALGSMHAVAEDARFAFQSGHDFVVAIERSRKKGDLPEHLVALAAKRSGATNTQTFDRAVRGLPEFEVHATRKA